MARSLSPVGIHRTTGRDEADDYLVALAQLADADAIVTLDNDLLDAQPGPCLRPTELLARLA
jgi:predicted nucleic acid-binding protein